MRVLLGGMKHSHHTLAVTDLFVIFVEDFMTNVDSCRIF
jgi:hypothetical protein